MTFCQDIYDMLCRKYPNSNIYVSSDHHLFHNNIIGYTRTNFKSVNEMNEYIINMHNKVVKENDIVLFLGDFCLRNSEVGPSCKNMNGHKYLVLGNHDQKGLEKKYHSLGFEGVYTTPIKINDNFFSHEPLIKGAKEDITFQGILNEFINCTNAKNYHGHIHKKEDNISHSYINVTGEAQDFIPVLIGKTTKPNNNKTPLFINSEQFESSCASIKKLYGLDTKLLLDDYIYSMMLESLTYHCEQSFIQGSFGLYKKYGYISTFSDLDISCIYNPLKSKNKNYSVLKDISDDMYEHLKNIDGVNLEFIKKFNTIRIFNASLAKHNNIFSNCYSDINLILLDCYKNSDFINLQGKSSVEKFLEKNNFSTLKDFYFPKFNVQALKPVGDISNLLLQIMFQQNNTDKKVSALKKLNYVYKNTVKDAEIENFLDTFIRLFLRNIALFSSWGRYGEIEYIKTLYTKIQSLIEPYIKMLPESLIIQIYDVLTNPNSLFLEIYDELVNTPTEKTLNSCTKIIKKIKG